MDQMKDVEVRVPGLQSSLQDWPGRQGYWRVGIPPSGPMDSVSFRLANLLVGNGLGETGLEFQFVGPVLSVSRAISIAIVGGDSRPELDGNPFPMGEVVSVEAGQTLSCGNVRNGARAYLAVAGGFQKGQVLGSAATFPRGGIGGAAIAGGEYLALKAPKVRRVGFRLKPATAELVSGPSRVVEVTSGPHFDWLSNTGRTRLLDETWKVTPRSDRTGIRLEGPALDFADRARNKTPENGSDPSNVINTGYPIGGVNICGNMPIILPVDGPSQGGFITPVVVASAALHKVGQLRPHDEFRFRHVTVGRAIALRRELELRVCTDAMERPA